jgi:hypothetical protein
MWQQVVQVSGYKETAEYGILLVVVRQIGDNFPQILSYLGPHRKHLVPVMI